MFFTLQRNHLVALFALQKSFFHPNLSRKHHQRSKSSYFRHMCSETFVFEDLAERKAIHWRYQWNCPSQNYSTIVTKIYQTCDTRVRCRKSITEPDRAYKPYRELYVTFWFLLLLKWICVPPSNGRFSLHIKTLKTVLSLIEWS